MKLWVVGADGLVGSHLKQWAHVASKRSDADIGNLHSLYAFAKKLRGITHIVNCAALSHVDQAERRREEAFCANAFGPENLAAVARAMNAKFLHLSTDYVFQGNESAPIVETHPTHPINYYGWTKQEGEKRLLRVLPSSCIVRTSWVFGEGGKNFVAGMLQKLQEPHPLLLTHDQRGRPTYAPDLADTIMRMLDASGVYHFANAGEASKYEFGMAMREEALGLGFPVAASEIIPVPRSFFPESAPRPGYSVFSTAKIESFLQKPIRPWRECLREYLCNVKSKES